MANVDNTPPRAGNRVAPTSPRPAGTPHEGQPIHDERSGATLADHGTARDPAHDKRRGTSPWVWVAVAAAVILLLLLFWPFGTDEAALVPAATPEVVATDPDITVEGTAAEGAVVEGTIAGETVTDDAVVTTVPVVPIEN